MKDNFALIIWYAAVLHVSWGMILMMSSVPLLTTPTYLLPNRQFFSGLILAIVGLSAGIGHIRRKHHRSGSLLALAPQQFIMLVSAFSALTNVVRGTYSDGYVPGSSPHLFILVDQLPTILAAVFHSIAVARFGATMRKG